MVSNSRLIWVTIMVSTTISPARVVIMACSSRPERIKSWHRKDMGLEVITGEEDPDSLSYGVYTTWLIHFGRA